MFESLKLKRFDNNALAYLRSLNRKDVPKALKSIIKKDNIEVAELTLFLNEFNDDEYCLGDASIKRKYNNMDIETLSDEISSLGGCESIQVVHNLTEEKQKELFLINPYFINFYRGTNEEIISTILSAPHFHNLSFQFEIDGKDTRKNLVNSRTFWIQNITLNPYEIKNYIGDDEEINKLIISIFVSNYKFISQYKGTSPTINNYIYNRIKFEPEIMESYRGSDEQIIDLIISIIKEDMEYIKYYNGNNERVFKEILSMGFIPSYENLKNYNINQCSNATLLKEAIKLDVRSIEFFTTKNNEELYQIFLDLVKSNYENIQYIYNWNLSELLYLEQKKGKQELYNIILDKVKENPKSLSLLSKNVNELINFDSSLEHPKLKNIILLETIKDISFLNNIASGWFELQDDTKILTALRGSLNTQKGIETVRNLVKSNPQRLDEEFIKKIFIPALKIDPTLVKDYKFTGYPEELEKIINDIFLEELKKDLSLIKYYDGNDERIYKYFFANDGKIDEYIISKAPLSEEILNNHKHDFIEILSKYNNASSEEIFNLLRYIVRNNDEFLKSFDLTLLNEEYLRIFRNPYTNKINANLLRVLGRYEDVRIQIKSIASNKSTNYIKLLQEIFYKFANCDYDYSVVIFTLLDSLQNYSKSQIFELVSNNISSIENKDRLLDNLIYLLTKKSIVKITSIEDVLNYEKLQDEKCLEFIENSDNHTIQELREAILLEKFGLDTKEACDLLAKYATNLNPGDFIPNEKDQQIINILTAISFIMNCQSKEQLVISYHYTKSKISLDLADTYKLDAEIRKMYARALNSKLLKVDELKSAGLEGKIDIPVHLAFDENNPKPFNILLTCLGAYSGYNRPSNYMNDWLRPKEISHGFCTSLISNEMMGTACLKYACLAFTDIPEENLLLQAPFDIGSNAANASKSTATDMNSNKLQFLFPKEMIDSTRHTHNELVIERLLKEGKVKPSYVIFMTESFNPDLLLDKPELRTEKEIEANPDLFRWQNAVQAAKDFGIPIVVIDRGKIKQYEHNEIEKLFEKFKKGEKESPQALFDLLIRLENNRAGCREYWNCDGLEPKNISNMIDRIFNVLEYKMSKNEFDMVINCCDELINWLDKERNKKGKKKKLAGNKELGIDTLELERRIISLKENALAKKQDLDYDITDIVTIIKNKYPIDISSFEKQFALLNNENFDIESSKRLIDVTETQLTPDEVEARFNILSNLINLNISNIQDLFTNKSDIRTSENMILLTALLATNNHNLRNFNLNILLEIAKFYKIADNKKASMLAFETLKGKYNNEELALIYSIIYTKDNPLSLEQVYKESLYNLNNNILISTPVSNIPDINIKIHLKEISELLKDAANLENAKNIGNNSLNINELSSNAKVFIDFAYRLAELQTVADLSYLSYTNKLEQDIIEHIVNYFEQNNKTITPKELLEILKEKGLIKNNIQERINENGVKL